MDAAELDYDLPERAIAQHPAEPRDSARLLVDLGAGKELEHRRVSDLGVLLETGDILVVNDTRVIPARLHLRKATGGAVEVLLLERRPEGWWEALVKPSRRVAPGTVLSAEDGNDFAVEVGDVIGDDGRRRVTLHGGTDDDAQGLDTHGEIPLPPYIHEPLGDPDRYQTVYADRPGSVAAPTAGLHITVDLLDELRSRGVTVATVELMVGLGTFRPITTERVEDHPMHQERYRIPTATVDLLTHRGDRRVVAVGTTVVRAVESWALTGKSEDATSLFIRDGFEFRVVDRLLTNFHVPKSSLLALVRAFVGPRWRNIYEEALSENYRFLSFGDAMLLTRERRSVSGDEP